MHHHFPLLLSWLMQCPVGFRDRLCITMRDSCFHAVFLTLTSDFKFICLAQDSRTLPNTTVLMLHLSHKALKFHCLTLQIWPKQSSDDDPQRW